MCFTEVIHSLSLLPAVESVFHMVFAMLSEGSLGDAGSVLVNVIYTVLSFLKCSEIGHIPKTRQSVFMFSGAEG